MVANDKLFVIRHSAAERRVGFARRSRASSFAPQRGAAGGGSRTRTGDIRLAKPTLYQLSYAPEAGAEGGVRQHRSFARGFAFILGGEASKLAPPCVAGSGPMGQSTN